MCELANWAVAKKYGPCRGGDQNHHILNRSQLMKAKAAKKFCEETHPEIFIAKICAAHNTSRMADTKEARRYLLQRRVANFGYEYVSGVLEELQTKFKVPRPELTARALLERPKSPKCY